MSLKFKLQTSGYIDWISSHYTAGDHGQHCVSWVLKVSYDENIGLVFERGYFERLYGEYTRLGELDNIQCQRRMVSKLSSEDPRLVSLVQWLKKSGVFGWELSANIMPMTSEWHLWRFILEMDGEELEWGMGVPGAPLPSFDAFKGFKFQDERELGEPHPLPYQLIKNSAEDVDVLGPSAWGQDQIGSADMYYFFPAQSHFHFCQGDPRMVELTRRVFDLLESRALPQVINYRDTYGRTLSFDFTRRTVKITDSMQSCEVKISEATLNAFWKKLDGRNLGQPAVNGQHWPNWPTHAHILDADAESNQDGTTKGFLWYAELCDGRDRWAGVGYSTSSWWVDHKAGEIYRHFSQLLSIDGNP